MNDQKHVRTGIWILFAVVIYLVISCCICYGAILFIKNLFYKVPNSPATVEGALDYLESKYDRRDYELTLLKVNEVEAYKEKAWLFDGAYYLRDAPARTETCYLGYSPQDDLYFYVFHSTDPEAKNAYSSTLRKELTKIENFEEAKTYASTVFGNRFKGTDVYLYTPGNLPSYYKGELNPIYSNPDIDAKSAYNRLLLDNKGDPFSSNILYTARGGFRLLPYTYLNVYIDYSLKELHPLMKEEMSNFDEISMDILFIANDGIYNYLPPEMKNELEQGN